MEVRRWTQRVGAAGLVLSVLAFGGACAAPSTVARPATPAATGGLARSSPGTSSGSLPASTAGTALTTPLRLEAAALPCSLTPASDSETAESFTRGWLTAWTAQPSAPIPNSYSASREALIDTNLHLVPGSNYFEIRAGGDSGGVEWIVRADPHSGRITSSLFVACDMTPLLFQSSDRTADHHDHLWALVFEHGVSGHRFVTDLDLTTKAVAWSAACDRCFDLHQVGESVIAIGHSEISDFYSALPSAFFTIGTTDHVVVGPVEVASDGDVVDVPTDFLFLAADRRTMSRVDLSAGRAETVFKAVAAIGYQHEYFEHVVRGIALADGKLWMAEGDSIVGRDASTGQGCFGRTRRAACSSTDRVVYGMREWPERTWRSAAST